MGKCQILLTNDDGIKSPGLWAAAEALSDLGFVTVAAPQRAILRDGPQPAIHFGRHHPDQDRCAYAARSGPSTRWAGARPRPSCTASWRSCRSRPDLVVSGINYGENVATGVTISGTVGAALEAASHGIPALAMSLETDREHHTSYSTEIDFSAAAWFTAYLCPPDVGEALSARCGSAQSGCTCQCHRQTRPGRSPASPASVTTCRCPTNGNPGTRTGSGGLCGRRHPG